MEKNLSVMDKNHIVNKVVFGLLAILVAFCFMDMLLDNWRVRNLGIDFDQLQHPPNSRLIERESATGHLVGNGKHCDFFVGEIRTYTGPAAKIQSFYTQQQLKHPNLLPVDDVIFVKGQRIPDDILDYTEHAYSQYPQDRNGWKGKSISSDKIYIVYYMNIGVFNQGCDIRCF